MKPMNFDVREQVTMITSNKTQVNRCSAAIPLLCLSHEKVSTPFTPIKWQSVSSYSPQNKKQKS